MSGPRKVFNTKQRIFTEDGDKYKERSNPLLLGKRG